jgi:hypothetical protein
MSHWSLVIHSAFEMSHSSFFHPVTNEKCRGARNSPFKIPPHSGILPGVPKWVKFILAVGMLPVCAGAARALWLVIQHSGSADTTWVPLLAGVACWLVIFLALPKPMWIYVLGHELTHALWTWACGGQVKKMKISSAGGHVVISKTNFVITLAPYVFPLYAVLVILVFAAGRLLWNWHLVYFHLTLGVAYAFHVTLTLYALRTKQSDITSQGYLFSAVVIFLGNVSILLLGIPLLAGRVSLLQSLTWWAKSTGLILQWLQKVI